MGIDLADFDRAPRTLLNYLLTGPLRLMDEGDQESFEIRFLQCYLDVLRPLKKLYGSHASFNSFLTLFLEITAQAYAQRPKELRRLDLERINQPDWFQQPGMVGYVAYADRFAGSLRGVGEKIPYLKEMGVTYLHLMPLLRSREGPNDGGYAVVDYCQVDPKLGEMEDLKWLARELRSNRISLCIDLVLNHTAKEHQWAQKAKEGLGKYQDYYYMFGDRSLPDEYERNLREIFPDFAPGSFTFYPDIEKWVWTTFNEYQWDLNYSNPVVLAEMLEIMLFLFNQGVDILRLDAVAFMWKRLGTDSENQPEAHSILQALRALSKICAPGTLLKAEAIVPPTQLLPYFGTGQGAGKECEVAYNNLFMVMLWSSLAERKVNLMTQALQRIPTIPSSCTWTTYIRCHDDIGWAVTEEDAGAVGLNGYIHRSFLSDFYSGQFPGSFATGATFQHNPATGDRRISGSLASLAGLEVGLGDSDQRKIDLAVKRILLMHNLIMAYGGIPLIYMGDEIGLLNDSSYLEDEKLADDNRWIHRPFMDWPLAENRYNLESVSGRIYHGLLGIIAARKRSGEFHARARAIPVWTHNEHVFGLIRSSARGQLLILANFSEDAQRLQAYRLQELGYFGQIRDRLDGRRYEIREGFELDSYQVVWLEKRESWQQTTGFLDSVDFV